MTARLFVFDTGPLLCFSGRTGEYPRTAGQTSANALYSQSPKHFEEAPAA